MTKQSSHFHSFLRGIGRLTNPLSLSSYSRTTTPKTLHEARRSDYQALKSDWDAVGNDLWYTISRLENEIGEDNE